MMEDHSGGQRVADYFVVAGLTKTSRPLEEEIQSEGPRKPPKNLAPITDVAIIIKSQGEKVPPGFTCVETTPSGLAADLNHGSIASPSIFLCVKRGYDKPPLTDIGILYEGKERVMPGCEIVSSTPDGHPANVSNRIGVNNQRAYITFRRASESAPHNALAVVDICVILMNKNESPPHAFCLINKNLNKGSVMGSDVYLCYKKSAIRGNSLVYQADMISRYPFEDHDDFLLPESVPRFCMPMGATIECWEDNREHPLPVFSTFVLTDIAGGKVYGAAVTFYENYPEGKLSEQQRTALQLRPKSGKKGPLIYNIHVNKCICLLSHFPFFEAFKKFLSFIYRVSISGPRSIPIERHISHFMHEVPFPTPQRPRILMELAHDQLILARPQTSPIPLSGASYCAMLRNLGPENSLNVLAFLLLEHKVVLHSLRSALLTGVAEAVSTLIFPFVWQCPYIPLCPLSLSDVLSAPMSVVVGIDSRYFDMYDPPSDAICIDIDTNTILQADDKKSITWKILPKKAAKRLYSTLSKLHTELCESSMGDGISDELAVEVVPIDLDFNLKKKRMNMELRIQDAFLTFMAMMLKGYSHHLLPITQQPSNRALDASSRFDYPGFMKTRDKASHVFFKQFLRTQMFIKFIEEISFVSDNDERFAFFDDCIEKVDVDSKEDVHLIELELQQDSEHTVFVMPPDADGSGATYDYVEFPVLQPELFHPPMAEVREALTPNVGRFKQGVANSPFPRRTKQEMRNSQKMAKMQAASPEQWANYLVGQSYALWFIHLPSYVKATHSKTRALRTAFEVLKKMQEKNIPLFDEVCYRVLMQLCGQYRQPVLAVQVFMEMRRRGIKPNAITYGHYNKAVLECQWPASSFSSYQQWVKLRNTLAAVTQFRRGIKHRGSSDGNSDGVSHSSADSGDLLGDGKDETDLIKLMDSSSSANLTREEKSSTGNSDMGYASMIMDETTPSDLLTSPELSPTKLARQRDSQCLDEEDEEEEEVEEEEEEKVASGFMKPGCGKPAADVGQRGEMERAGGGGGGTGGGEGRGGEEREKEAENHEITLIPEAALMPILERDTSADVTLVKSKSAPVSEASTPISRRRLDLGGKDSPGEGLFGIPDTEEEPTRRSSSILRRSRSSVTSREGIHVVLDTSNSSMNANTSLMDTDNLDENEFDEAQLLAPQSPRRRHKSAGDHSWSLPVAFRKRNSSGGDATTSFSDSLASPEKLNNVINEDLFGCDSKILESLRTNGGESGESGTHSRSLSLGSRPQNMSRTGEDFSVDVKPLADEVKGELIDVCHKIEALNSESQDKSKGESQDSSEDLLISFNEKNSKEVVDSGSSNLIELVESDSKPIASNTPNGIADHSPVHALDSKAVSEGTTQLGTEDPAATTEKPLENGKSVMGQSELYKLESMESLPSNSSSETKDSKESLSSHKPRKTPKRASSFLSGLLTSPFTPRMSKQSLSRTFQSASSQMETLRSRATDFASKLGEYTRQLSSPAVQRDSQSNPSLIDFDEAGLENGRSDLRDIAGSWNESKLDSLNPEDVGIHMPGSQFAGSTQSLNNPLVSDQEDGYSSGRQYAMHVFMTSCFRCGACKSALFDEHIMAGWAADDSNLNTSCAFCGSPRVPFLTVTIKDLREPGGRCTITPSPSAESMQSIQSAPFLQQGDSLQGKEEPISTYQSNPSVDNLSLGSEGEGDPKPGLTGCPRPSGRREPALHHTASDVPLRENLKRNPVAISPSAARRRTVSECMVAEDLLKEVESAERPGNEFAANMRAGTSYSLPRCKTIQESGHGGNRLLADLTFSTSSLPSSMRGSRECLAPPPRKDVDPDPVSVPYLSPLVLRKEIENVIDNEGEECLRQPSFVFQHPIIFWNLIWYFRRLDMPNYLEGALLAAYSENRDANDGSRYLATDSRYVKVIVLWDNLTLYKEDGVPMYIHWTPNAQAIKNAMDAPDRPSFTNAFMLQIVKLIRYNNVFIPITMLLDEFQRQNIPIGSHRSIYRELLFLSFIALGRENVDHDAFDQQYRIAYSKLREDQKELMQKNDRPPPRAVQMCRSSFGDLSL
ncbi:C-myc promoter-binding protein-like [Diadema antillarum]|uniref:C-myc promoter-binding protein-like n=1 Tax=Diadema antillarum TaxID=105358 RepID=UPI003A8A03F7